MIDLYGMTSPNVVKIILMLEETGLPYRFNWVSIWSGQQFTPEFLELNPNGKVPVIVDENGPGGKPCRVFESGAILIYLAEKSGQLLPRESVARYEVLEWMMIQLTGVGPAFGQHVHFTRFAPEQSNEYARSRYATEVRRLLEVLDRRLQRSAYLAGEQYSVADVATYPWISALAFLGLEAADYPALARWTGTIAERPAARRARARTEELRPRTQAELNAASAEDKDRLFGRGRFARA
jgi:GST-like protein